MHTPTPRDIAVGTCSGIADAVGRGPWSGAAHTRTAVMHELSRILRDDNRISSKRIDPCKIRAMLEALLNK
jgi:hypothetical protein